MAGGEEEPRFAGYPRFRGAGRHHAGAFAAGAGGAPLLHAPHLPAHRAPPDDDALYETADAERLRDAPDSER